jgi:hypothetical protein
MSTTVFSLTGTFSLKYSSSISYSRVVALVALMTTLDLLMLSAIWLITKGWDTPILLDIIIDEFLKLAN